MYFLTYIVTKFSINLINFLTGKEKHHKKDKTKKKDKKRHLNQSEASYKSSGDIPSKPPFKREVTPERNPVAKETPPVTPIKIKLKPNNAAGAAVVKKIPFGGKPSPSPRNHSSVTTPTKPNQVVSPKVVAKQRDVTKHRHSDVIKSPLTSSTEISGGKKNKSHSGGILGKVGREFQSKKKLISSPPHRNHDNKESNHHGNNKDYKVNPQHQSHQGINLLNSRKRPAALER